MCGIFGLISNDRNMKDDKYRMILKELFILSESRGKEASGMCVISKEKITVVKAAMRARKFIKAKECIDALKEEDNSLEIAGRTVIGHARMVTNGEAKDVNNNQPVLNSELVCIHNGIIVNDEELWEKNPQLSRRAKVDTEVLIELVSKYYKTDLADAFLQTIKEIEGSVSVALTSKMEHNVLLYTNIGSLYLLVSKNKKNILFTSERYIAERVVQKVHVEKEFDISEIYKLPPNSGVVIDLDSLDILSFESYRNIKNRKIYNKTIDSIEVKCQKDKYRSNYVPVKISELSKMMQVDVNKIKKLRRCTKCLLPETFPGITFDENGVCSICHQYKPKPPKGGEALLEIINRNKTKGSHYDCIIPVSGGRDSCYCLHYAVKELGLRPVAYTYDWGMVTDLARRNIQRMCSQLQVEHILISADIGRKRNNVKMNVEAWLKRPNVATVPLFMAGDKQFFYYAQLLKRQMKVDNIFFGMNRLEETDFKVAFTGINGKSKDGLHYNLSKTGKLQMCLYYGKEFIKNPSFINSSLLDSFGGFISYYLLNKDYLQFFDYIQWNEDQVADTILKEYNWETAKDTKSTWRIGDGTAPFYNYIYYRICGFSEYDTFRSNQIREGMLSRQQAIAHIYEENEPRVEAFDEYCRIIGIDTLEAVKVINKQKTLY